MKDLFQLVESVKGCKFATIRYIADCGFPKKSGLSEARKMVEGVFQLNYDYTTAVKNRIAKSGGNPDAFVGESLRWGSWEIHNKVITHKGNRYLRYYGVENQVPKVTYYMGDRLATEEEVNAIKAYLATKDTKSQKQSDAGLTDHQVVPRNVEFGNVLYLKVDGEEYTATKAVA